MPKKLSTIVVVLLLSYEVLATDSYLIRPAVHEGYEVKQDLIQFRNGNAGITIKCAQAIDVSGYYSTRGAPFIGNPFQREEFGNPTVFLLTIFNRTNGNATFTPGLVAIKIKDDASFPLDYVTLMQAIEGLPSRDKRILEESIYHSPETIRSGEVVSKFLLFPPLPDKHLEFRLEFDYLYFESKEVRTKFYFTKERIRAKE
ncbi:MAG TPA: hypothetical protein VLH08_07205 [Acidobacteriota bacterium]|nr:hypothetical protein [Acidobacteriota bacterium]